MERITERFTNGEAFCDDPFAIKDVGVYETIWKGKIVDKLAYYEDREEKGEFYNWIPCSERLAEDAVICCSKEGDALIGFLEKSETGYIACDDDGTTLHNCVAWTPLPEPYKGE